MVETPAPFTAGGTRPLPQDPIFVIAPWSQGGGAQGALVHILRQLPTERVVVALLFSGNRNHGAIAENAAHVIECDEPRSPVGILRARRRLLDLLDGSGPVYSLMRGSHLVLGTLPGRRLRSMRLVATFHQLPSQDAAGLQGKIEDVLVRRAIKHATLVTAPAQSAVDELRDSGYAPADRIAYEPNGIAVTTIDAPPARSGALDELRLVFAGRLSAQKGLDRIPELLNASAVPITLRIIGDGEERALVESLPSAVDARHRVEVVGHSDAIVDHLDWSDALLLPSRWELNPLIIWEARARGRGTIASTIPPLLALGDSGPMWFFDDADGFAAIARTLVDQPTVRTDAHARALASVTLLEGNSRIVEHLSR